MLSAGWLVLAVTVAILLTWWVTFTVTRLDRLHARVDAAQATMDAQFVRRAAALALICESPGARAMPEAAEMAEMAHSALSAPESGREQAENDVSRAIGILAALPIERAGLSGPAGLELDEASARAAIARRFYNDAVRDTRSLRARRMPRYLHLSGRRDVPQFFDIEDAPRAPGRIADMPALPAHIDPDFDEAIGRARGNRRQDGRIGATASLAAFVLLIAGCSGGGSDSSESSPLAPKTSSTPPPSTSAAPTTPAPPPPPAVNPLTGVVGVPAGPVIAVKIDDTGNGRPQIGLDMADVVYIEQAEGGLTRLVAVYASQKPVVGPVRSVRASDSELLSQYGAIALASSGGAQHAVETLDASILVDARWDNVESAYSRTSASGRYAPYNLVADLGSISAQVKANGVQNVGFAWAADDPRLAAAPVASQLSTTLDTTGINFTWDAATSKYQRVIDGVPQVADDGAALETPNVLVQFCAVETDTQDIDVNGSPSQFTQSTGSGPASLFRSGHRVDGTWSRATLDSPTTFTAADGQPMLLAPGGAWVVLAPAGSPLTSG